MSDLCQNVVQGVLNPEGYGSSRPCDFLGLKWTNNNVDKTKKPIFDCKKNEENELNEQRNHFLEHLIKESY